MSRVNIAWALASMGIDGHWWHLHCRYHSQIMQKPLETKVRNFKGFILTKWAEDSRQSASYVLGKCFPVCFFLEVEGKHKMVKCFNARSDILFLE